MKQQKMYGTGFRINSPAGYSYAIYNKGQRIANADGDDTRWGWQAQARHMREISAAFNIAVAAKVSIDLESMKRNIWQQFDAAGYFEKGVTFKDLSYSEFWAHWRSKAELKYLEQLVNKQKAAVQDSIANKETNTGYDIDSLANGVGASSEAGDPMMKWIIGGIIGLGALIVVGKLIKRK